MQPINYTNKEVILKATNLGLTIDDNVILRDVNIEIKDIHREGVEQGQILSFLGPTGMGKSQLFSILAGLKKPTTGDVLVGVDLKPVKVGDVSVVQQHYPLFNYMTVKGNLMLGAKQGKMETGLIKDKIAFFLDRFGMTEHIDKYPSQLSGGQRQRVAIMQQILCSNKFLFLDEPFSGLDVNMIRKVSDVIKEVSLLDEYNTIIIISHDVVSSCALSDTVHILGRDSDANGKKIPGAKIQETLNLAEMGLAWQPDIKVLPEFIKLIDGIEKAYPLL